MRLSGDASDQPQVALEREALTAKMETVPLKLGLRVALVGEGFPAAPLPESEVHINLRLTPSWFTLDFQLQLPAHFSPPSVPFPGCFTLA